MHSVQRSHATPFHIARCGKVFFKCIIDRYLHNDTTKDFMQCWSWDIDLLHYESAEQWEFEMYYLAQEFSERIKVGNLTPYRMIVDLSDDMNNTDFSSDGDFFRGCFMALLGLTWYSLKDCWMGYIFCQQTSMTCGILKSLLFLTNLNSELPTV